MNIERPPDRADRATCGPQAAHGAAAATTRSALDFRLHRGPTGSDAWSQDLLARPGRPCWRTGRQSTVDTLLPGCTHLQPAQPVSLGHHLLAYAWMFKPRL